MRRSIATVSISGTLEDKLEAIARARFDAVEIFENDLIYSPRSPAELRTLCSDLGLDVDLYQPLRDFEAVPDAQFKRNLDRAERKFDLMQELGAPMVLVCSNVQPHTVDDDELAAAQLYELAERAGRRGLRVCYEALAWGRQVNDYRHSWRIVERANHPHLGVCLDSFHVLSRGDDPSDIERIPGDKIFFLQLSDAPRMGMDILQWSRHYRSFPGQGVFDLARFVEHTLAAGYHGPLSLEIFNDIFREAPNRRTAMDGMQSLLHLEEQVRARLAARDETEHASRRIELFDPPEAPELRGISFIEFAVDRMSHALLAHALEKMGFVQAGKHRSKDVTLYQQGDIHLVMNQERGSFAADFFAKHGPSVCAMALETDDGQRAVNRAVAFHAPRFEGRIGPKETVIPAIRSVDDSLLYFVSESLAAGNFFEVDFEMARPEANAATVGLTQVDHVAKALPVESFDTGILFHRVMLGLEPEQSLELSDPFGLVRSSAMVDAEKRVRLALNVSQSRSTGIARSISQLHGAGVHHVAFACADIFEATAQMRKNGVPLLQVPENYYADLATKFDLPAELIARMRSLNILYDRSEVGEFFHAYTETFLDRFFFEVVQRRGDYEGYGASNAPVRMAAQTRPKPEV